LRIAALAAVFERYQRARLSFDLARLFGRQGAGDIVLRKSESCAIDFPMAAEPLAAFGGQC
jgi:hypothetical protein